MGLRVKEDGKSEGRSVIELIGVESLGNITPRESGQTSIGSFLTKSFGQPSKETEQMTAVSTAVSVSHRVGGALAPSQYRQVHAPMGCERVPQGAFERLELHDAKVSRVVLRG